MRLNNSRPPSESAPFAAQLLQQQAEEVTDEARRLVHDALLDLANARAVLYETAAHQLAELATTIARRVIAHELSLNPAIVRNLVEEGMHALERQDRLFVRVGREFASLRDVLAAQLAGQSEHVDVVVDPTLADYGCVVETEHGWVDESVETRLATLLQALHADSGAP